MEPTVSSETSAIRTQTPGNYPKRNKLRLEHGKSLKTRISLLFLSYDANITLFAGSPVFARWTDKKYYSGRLQESCKDGRWKVLFDDTSVKLLVEDFVIAVDQLPLGQLVYAVAESGDYESGVIVNVKKYVPCHYCKVESLFRKTRLHIRRKLSVYIYALFVVYRVFQIVHVTVSLCILNVYHVGCFLYWKRRKLGSVSDCPVVVDCE